MFTDEKFHVYIFYRSMKILYDGMIQVVKFFFFLSWGRMKGLLTVEIGDVCVLILVYKVPLETTTILHNLSV